MKPDYNGLSINPSIPSKWDGYKITRRFRGATYHIEVSNPSHVSNGVSSMEVDGKTIEGWIVPIQPKGTEVTVKVTLGK
ncbi:glycosyl hydrolase family 65 protein [Teredinibacter turnerae]|uniref:glycosyl hydrolase family 65 protein n=1 Tax=Teredinibacter turnerae TaxID=2426 RepID=UPI0030CEF30B